MFTSDPDGGLPPLPPAPDPWPLAGVHDFDRVDGQGRCRRPQCREPFLDAGPECPGDELSQVDAAVAAITDEEVNARLAAITGQPQDEEPFYVTAQDGTVLECDPEHYARPACGQPKPPGEPG